METAKDFMVQVGKAAGKVARSAQHMTSGQSLSHAC
jgi:hypothetical protein